MSKLFVGDLWIFYGGVKWLFLWCHDNNQHAILGSDWLQSVAPNWHGKITKMRLFYAFKSEKILSYQSWVSTKVFLNIFGQLDFLCHFGSNARQIKFLVLKIKPKIAKKLNKTCYFMMPDNYAIRCQWCSLVMAIAFWVHVNLIYAD